MTIHRLQLDNFRNLHQLKLEPSPHINIIHGDNGSGKTNLLEAIFFLTHGRSFKLSRNNSLVEKGADSATVFANVGDIHLPVGIQRHAKGATEIRISGEPVAAVSELAKLVPLQFINSEAFQILEGSPKYRRQFLDWGVFHVEQSFVNVWRSSQKALKNRNSLLRSGRIDRQQLEPWERELIHYSNLVDESRKQYLKGFETEFTQLLKALVDIPDINLGYQRGWDKTKTLREVLTDSLDRDRKSGFTHSGPQRADLKVRIGKDNVSDFLSRGQQKMVVAAMKIAQGHYLHKAKEQKRCIYLIDDLPAELDREHLKKVCQVLDSLDAQIFISCIDPEIFSNCWQDSNKVRLFHVEHGALS